MFRNILEVYALKAKELSSWSLKSGGCHVKTSVGHLPALALVASPISHTLSKHIALSESRIQTAVWSELHHGSHAESKPEEPGPGRRSSWCYSLCWHCSSEARPSQSSPWNYFSGTGLFSIENQCPQTKNSQPVFLHIIDFYWLIKCLTRAKKTQINQTNMHKTKPP